MTRPARASASVFLVAIAVFLPRGTVVAQQQVPRELHRTPSGEILDYAPDGAWRKLARNVAARRHELLGRGDFAALNASVGGVFPSPLVISGTKKIPTIMFRYQDVGTGATNTAATYASVLWGSVAPGGGRPYTVRTFYSQMSNGMLTLEGTIIGWHTLSQNEAQYTGGANCGGGLNPFGGSQCNGIFSSAASTARVAGLNEALSMSDTADFAQYDNDGPDGNPNSGDDDGFVDLVIFLHSEQDGACFNVNNGHIWSHKSALSTPFVTNDARSGGGFVRIQSYTVQSGVGGSTSCNASQVMSVGTPAHETGHAFGLPDLYDTQTGTEGIGEWGLMGSGNYARPFSPSRMEAWSLNELGWVTLAPITVNGTYTVRAAPTSDSAFVIRVQGTNSRKEYYFIENRQAVESDTASVDRHCLLSGFTGWTPGAGAGTCHGGLAIWHADSTKIQQGRFSNTVNTGTGVGSPHGLALVQADGLNHLRRTSGGNRGDAGDLWPGYRGGDTLGKRSYLVNTNPNPVANDSTTFVGFHIDQITQVVPDGEMSFRVTFGFKVQATVNGVGTVASTPTYNLSPGSFVAKDAQVTLTATPTGTASFTGWTGDVSSGTNPLVLTMNRNYSVIANFTSPVTIISSAPVGGAVGKPYSFTLSAAGGSGAYAWSVLSGSLPTGLTLNPSTGALTGTPSVAGTYNATVRVTANAQTSDQAVSIVITEPTLVVANVLGHLLGTSPSALSTDDVFYVDFLGNKNGSLDVGDFLAWVNKTNAASTGPAPPARVQDEGTVTP